MALQFPHQVWETFRLLLRTRSRALPAERTVKDVLTQEFVRHARNVTADVTMPFMAPGASPEEPGTQRTPIAELFMVIDAQGGGLLLLSDRHNPGRRGTKL